jgi:hypothetical protein
MKAKKLIHYFTVPSINRDLLNIRVPTEFSRKTRELDFANLKAEEYRNIFLFYFEVVGSKLRPKNPEDYSCPRGYGEQEVWYSMVFLIRALLLPEEEYTFLERRIVKIQKELYVAYQVSEP